MKEDLKKLITAEEYRHLSFFFDDNSSINDMLKFVSRTKDGCSICKNISDRLNAIDNGNESRIY